MTTMTTIRVRVEVRDRLEAAGAELGAVTLGDALDRLLIEREEREILAAYEALKARPEDWAGYLEDLAEWDVVTSDGIVAE